MEETGTITEISPNMLFTVTMSDGEELKCVPKGKLKHNRIRLFLGDKVTIERVQNSERHYITYRNS